MRLTADTRLHPRSAAWALCLALGVGLLGCGPELGGTGEPAPPGSVGVRRSPAFRGRIARDGRAFVGKADGLHFLWRGVSEHLLAWYLVDPSRSAREAEELVAGRLNLRVAQGFSVVRVLGASDGGAGGGPVRLRPLEDTARYRAALRRLLELARERGLYVEWVLLGDVGTAVPRERLDEHIDWAAGLAQELDNTFVEIAHEGWRALPREEIVRLGRRFKERAPDVLLSGTSPAPGTDARAYGAAPFDYVTLHGDRTDGDGGWRWVVRLVDGEQVGAATDRPVVQDEPMPSAGTTDPGQRDSAPARFRAAALVCHATRQYFTFHHACALQPTASPTCADVPTPGVDEVQRSDLISGDPRDGRFVDGAAPEAPLDAAQALGAGALLRLYSKVYADGAGFFSYPVHVKGEAVLRLKDPIVLTVIDAASGRVLSSRNYGRGEAVPLAAGSDLVLTGGRAPPPPPPPPMDPVPAQQPAADVMVRTYTAAQATTIVHRLYQAVFGRDADPSGLGSYQPLVAGGRLPRVTSILVQSGEFEARRPGLTAQRLSEDMYRAILGRMPDEGGRIGTQEAIKAGRAAQRLADMVLSPEYEANRL